MELVLGIIQSIVLNQRYTITVNSLKQAMYNCIYKGTFFPHVQENTYSIVDVQPPVYNGLAFPNHALSDSNPGLWLSMEE